MDQLIDLEEASSLIDERVAAWRAAGISVGAVTWRDAGRGWPPPITSNRDEVLDADSVGVALAKGEQEGSVVLFVAGFADFEYWDGVSPDSVVLDAPGSDSPITLSEFGDVLDRLAALFR